MLFLSGFYCKLNASSVTPNDNITGGQCPKGKYCPRGSVEGDDCPKGLLTTYCNISHLLVATLVFIEVKLS
jgi:hypothetical protein